MKTKLIILMAVFLATGCLFAGSAPPATPAHAAPQARTGPIAPTPVAPSARQAPVAPIRTAPVAPTAPVGSSPLAPIAPSSVSPRNLNSNVIIHPYAYTYTYRSNSVYFTNDIPTAYLRNTNSVYWATNPPYGNPVVGYTNNLKRTFFPYRRIHSPATNANQTPSPKH